MKVHRSGVLECKKNVIYHAVVIVVLIVDYMMHKKNLLSTVKRLIISTLNPAGVKTVLPGVLE